MTIKQSTLFVNKLAGAYSILKIVWVCGLTYASQYLVHVSCNGSILRTVALPVVSTHLLTSGVILEHI